MMIVSSKDNHPDFCMQPPNVEMARSILRYLIDHKDAADTLEGIMRWWILKDTLEERMSVVRASIDILLREGWIQQRSLPGSQDTLYSLNRSKMQQLREWLAATG